MKKIKKHKKEECNLCKEVALYDCQTKFGPWAFLCEKCFKVCGTEIGTKFEYVDESKPINHGVTVKTSGLVNKDEVMESNDPPEWRCPICKDTRELEVDSY